MRPLAYIMVTTLVVVTLTCLVADVLQRHQALTSTRATQALLYSMAERIVKE
ncbi:MAG: hypothetical protein WAX89_01060 [Alphaproteobacteria bacterium]